MIAVIHPGQGSQQLGMFDGFQSRIFKDTIEEASDILHTDLRKIADRSLGNESVLAENSQICVSALSMAIDRLWKYSGGMSDYRAGHSMGEFSAYSAAGSFSFSNLLKTIAHRTKVMNTSFPLWEGYMMKVKDVTTEKLKKLMEGFDIEIACFNTPDTHIVSGLKQNLDNFKKFLGDNNISTVDLSISLPCHSKFMIPSVKEMKNYLESIPISVPSELVVNCYFSKVSTDKQEIITGLSEQMSAPVKWVDTIKFLVKNKVDKFVVFGPKVGDYHRMIQSIFPETKSYIISDDDSLERTLNVIKHNE